MKAVVRVELPIALWKEEDQFVVFTPALELSTYGPSQQEAIESFSEAVSLFFETAIERKVLRDLLESLGWVAVDDKWIPAEQPVGQSFPVDIPAPHVLQ